jgi:CheY-like chemotaxis protein
MDRRDFAKGTIRPGQGAPRRVLIVDDDLARRERLVRALDRRVEVHVAATGAQGFHLVANHEPFDLVLCQLRMDGMSGLELVHAVRKRTPAEAGRIVLVSTEATAHEIALIERRAVPLVLLPAGDAALGAAVQDLIERAR